MVGETTLSWTRIGSSVVVVCVIFALAIQASEAIEPALQPKTDSKTVVDDDPQSILDRSWLSRPWNIERREEPIDLTIDGRPSESVWDGVPVHETLKVVNREPDNFYAPANSTRTKLFYTDKGLYVSAVMEQDHSTFVRLLTAPDGGSLTRDFFTIGLDTSGEGKYGYYFTICLGDTKMEGLLRPPRGFDRSWDGAWWGRTAVTDEGWSAEMFIPWSVMNMPKVDGDRKIGLYISRNVPHDSEHYAWPAIHWHSQVFMTIFQPIVFKEVSPRQQLSFFPYLAQTQDEIEGTSLTKQGFDVFWRPSTDFQLTGTITPDYGTVEADAVVINLTAYETFFPEKRLFFQEGVEVFQPSQRSTFSTNRPAVLLLHTRRIGAPAIFPDIPSDAEFDYSQLRRASEIRAATKATGKVGQYRYGVLAAMEEDSEFHAFQDTEPLAIKQEGRDFRAMRLLHESAGAANSTFGFMSTSMQHPSVNAKTHGFDGRIQMGEGRFFVESQMVMSSVEDERGGYGGFIDIRYSPSPSVRHQFSYETFDRNLNLRHMGYIDRNNYTGYAFTSDWRHFDYGSIEQSNTRVELVYAENSEGERLRAQLFSSTFFTFKNRNVMWVGGNYSPSTVDDRNSFNNGSFRLNSTWFVGLDWGTDSTKRLFHYSWIGTSISAIGEHQYTIHSSWTWRPLDRINLYATGDYFHSNGWVLHQFARNFTGFQTEQMSIQLGSEYFLSADHRIRVDLQWRGYRAFESRFFQLPVDSLSLVEVPDPDAASNYDFAISRLNLQFRFHWQIAPLSDFYLVYTKSASLPDALGLSFLDAFSDTFAHPVSEFIAAKVRYRIGSGSRMPRIFRRNRS